jgi:hypothetical protein
MGLQWYPPPRNEAGRQMGKDKTEEQIERSERDRLAAEAAHRAPWWRRIFRRSAR